jgi:hypothetical protein
MMERGGACLTHDCAGVATLFGVLCILLSHLPCAESQACADHASCSGDTYCDYYGTCYGCDYVRSGPCDAIDGDCSTCLDGAPSDGATQANCDNEAMACVFDYACMAGLSSEPPDIPTVMANDLGNAWITCEVASEDPECSAELLGCYADADCWSIISHPDLTTHDDQGCYDFSGMYDDQPHWTGGTMAQTGCSVSWSASFGSCTGTLNGDTLTWDSSWCFGSSTATGTLQGDTIYWSNGNSWERTGAVPPSEQELIDIGWCVNPGMQPPILSMLACINSPAHTRTPPKQSTHARATGCWS